MKCSCRDGRFLRGPTDTAYASEPRMTRLDLRPVTREIARALSSYRPGLIEAEWLA